jgi:hypothetical protein
MGFLARLFDSRPRFYGVDDPVRSILQVTADHRVFAVNIPVETPALPVLPDGGNSSRAHVSGHPDDARDEEQPLNPTPEPA